MSLPAQSGAHSKHALAYHLVWCVKYRRSVLIRAIGDRLKEILTEIATAQGAEIISVETDVDHVHVLIRLKPIHSVATIAKRLKGASAYKLFREFPSLKYRLWGGHLWSPSYYVATTGGATVEAVKKYVESQRRK